MLRLRWSVPPGLSAFLAMPVGIGAAVALALLVNAVFYRPLKHLPTIVTVISSFGIALMVRATVQLIWGTDIQTYQSGIQKPLILFDTFRIAERHIWIVLITAGLIILLHHFLARTKTGKAMRAVADDPALASVSGIDIEHVVRWVLGDRRRAGGCGRYISRHRQSAPHQYGLGPAAAGVCKQPFSAA